MPRNGSPPHGATPVCDHHVREMFEITRIWSKIFIGVKIKRQTGFDGQCQQRLNGSARVVVEVRTAADDVNPGIYRVSCEGQSFLGA